MDSYKFVVDTAMQHYSCRKNHVVSQDLSSDLKLNIIFSYIFCKNVVFNTKTEYCTVSFSAMSFRDSRTIYMARTHCAMNELSQEEGARKKEKRVVGRKRKRNSSFISKQLSRTNRTLYDLILKTQTGKNKTQAMSDHQHRKHR